MISPPIVLYGVSMTIAAAHKAAALFEVLQFHYQRAEAAVNELQGLLGVHPVRVSPDAPQAPRRDRMSPAARRRQSQRMKQYWAAKRAAAKAPAKKAAPSKTKRRTTAR